MSCGWIDVKLLRIWKECYKRGIQTNFQSHNFVEILWKIERNIELKDGLGAREWDFELYVMKRILKKCWIRIIRYSIEGKVHIGITRYLNNIYLLISHGDTFNTKKGFEIFAKISIVYHRHWGQVQISSKLLINYFFF